MSEYVVKLQKLIKSNFFNRTQRVQMDNVLSDLLILFVVFFKAQL